MKPLLALTLLTLTPFTLALTGCAEQPLQRIVDEHKQQRVHDAYAGKPLDCGSGDGIGLYSARAAETPLTLSAAR